MLNKDKAQKEKLKAFHEQVQQEADGIVKYFILGYYVFGILISFFYSSWELGVVMGSVSLGIYYLFQALMKGTYTSRLVTSALMWNFPLQFILQLHGGYEMYFFYFVSLTVLLFYEEWEVLMPAAVYALLTFIFIYHSQTNDDDLLKYLDKLPPLADDNAFLHLIVVLGYGALCVLWANIQFKQTEKNGLRYIEMESQLSLMDVNISFANNISQGQLGANYDAEEPDRLGRELMNMRESLVEASEREAKEKFVNVGLASIGEILRRYSDDLDVLCDKVIEKLVNYMSANQGGVFIIQGEEHEEKYLQLMSSRAYERKKYLNKRIEIGEGLIGQAALEKKSIYMTKLPSNYINITSGLGLSVPKALLIVPLQSNEELVGVIEMAAFEEFSETEIEFLEKVGESIASTIISAKTNQATKELLEESTQMSEEMRAQEEEMRQNMEEMQATQEEMGRTQRELAAKESDFNALINNTSDSIVTIDKNYRILIMNEVIKARYKGTQYESIKEGSDLLGNMTGDIREEWKSYYDRAFGGERLNFTIKSTVHGEDSWREYYVNPVRDASNEISAVSVFSRDVTNRMKLEIERSEKNHIVRTLLNNADDMLMAIDSNYTIVEINEKYRESIHQIYGSNLQAGSKVLDSIGEDQRASVRAQYDRVLAGESVDTRYEVEGGVFHSRYEPIYNDEHEVFGVAVCSKLMATKK